LLKRLLSDDSGSVGWVLIELAVALVACYVMYLLLSVPYNQLQTNFYNTQSSGMTMNNSTAQGFNVLAYAWQNQPLVGFLVLIAGTIVAAVAYRLKAAG
jgi:hypothetical protein